MFVIGVCAIMTPIMVQKDTIARDIPLSVICALLLLGLGYLALGDAHGMILGHFGRSCFSGRICGIYFLYDPDCNESKNRREKSRDRSS